VTGRKPIPTALKLITGKSGRGINKAEPQPARKMPDPPVTLSPSARSTEVGQLIYESAC
jgi:hypothetical protein